MNALANSQLEELEKFLHDFEKGKGPFTVARYTGQEDMVTRQGIADNLPDILLTNFMMLELLLTRYQARASAVMDHCDGLQFLVLDELHTYRGRQGADVAMAGTPHRSAFARGQPRMHRDIGYYVEYR